MCTSFTVVLFYFATVTTDEFNNGSRTGRTNRSHISTGELGYSIDCKLYVTVPSYAKLYTRVHLKYKNDSVVDQNGTQEK